MIVFLAIGIQKSAVPQSEIIVFPTIKYNDGSGYNNLTGKFTATVAGLYAFAKLTCAYLGKSAITAFIHNGHSVLASEVTTPSSENGCTSAQLFVQMLKGDQMWVESVWYGTQILFTTHVHETNFTGSLIHG